MSKGKLTPKQALFAQEYLVDLNATAAARRAGYSAKTADRIGPELLGKTWVREAIEKGKAKRAAKVELTADMVLSWLMDNRNKAAADSKYGDVNRACELLGKHLAMFKDSVEVSEPARLKIVKVLVNAGDCQGDTPSPSTNGVH